MQLAFTAEQEAFRAEIRAWVAAHLPKDISDKVHRAQRLHKEDLQRWARILGKKGWHGWACWVMSSHRISSMILNSMDLGTCQKSRLGIPETVT